MKMTNEERKALIGFINAEIARIQRKEELWDGDRMRIASHRLSLAALTAEPVAWEVKGILCHTKEEADKYVGTPVPLMESLIDNTAQQYEALAGWKMVPVEPTAEMYDAGDKQLATKQVWDAMLAAAPKPEGQ
ncbi:hypothetical protein [Mixta calida]|uniref:DUF550 domain-containing protein n=1 Tax=Mixta calida TaxID=665913 RepID=A0ABN5HCK3_9GAMM|nr:hypothetical protein [Mixta calida]AUY25535.1 hypothetical protein C2E16_11860 [Mixta calida]ORM57241.1 hypothetical protein HA40_12815 [Mixta calida]